MLDTEFDQLRFLCVVGNQGNKGALYGFLVDGLITRILGRSFDEMARKLVDKFFVRSWMQHI